MTIDVETLGDSATVTLTGSLIAGQDLETLRDTLDDLLRRGYRHIVLDLSGVPMIDSACLGEIVPLYTTVSRQGGKLKLLGLTNRIRDLLSISKLLTPVGPSNSSRPDARWYAAVWVTLGVLLVLALLIILRLSGVSGLP